METASSPITIVLEAREANDRDTIKILSLIKVIELIWETCSMWSFNSLIPEKAIATMEDLY